MPKTKDAFALRKLYYELLTHAVQTGTTDIDELPKINKYIGINLFDIIIKYLNNIDDNHIDSIKIPIDDFNSQRDSANLTMELIRKLKRRSDKLDKHNQRIYKYVDAVTNKLIDEKNTDDCIQKIRRAKTLISKYASIDRVFSEYADVLREKFREIALDLEKIFLKNFGERLQKARYKKKLSRKEIADRLGMTEGGYGFYERGERELSLFKVYRLAKFLEVSADWLLGIDIR